MTRDWWLEKFSAWAESPALVENDQVITYGALARNITATAEYLRAKGVRSHSVVILNSDFSAAGIASFFALAYLRAILIPIVETSETHLDVARLHCGADFLVRVAPELKIESLQKTARPTLYETLETRGTAGLVLLSSGSTGTAKAILHDLDALLAAQEAKTVKRRLKVVVVLRFDHIGGINTLLKTLLTGGVAISLSERTPEATCRMIQAHQVKVLPASPTFLNLILIGGFHERFDLSSLRLITYGTEPMTEDLLRRLRAAFPKARFLQTFGTSETGIASTLSESSGSIFFKIEDPNISYRVVDDELQLKSATAFLGYVNHDRRPLTEDGWFRTGDLVERSSTGFIRIRGRVGEVINVGGQKILPVELETILLKSPLIADCRVYGEFNAIAGQTICADIVPREPSTNRAEMRKHLHTFLGPKIERFMIPTRVNLFKELPYSLRFKKLRRS